MNTASKTLLLLTASSLISSVSAGQPEEILKVKKSTFVNLVDLLVQRGVINRQEGKGLVSAAEQEAAEVQEAPAVTTDSKIAGKTKHVSYVPEFVKKEIRDQVRTELKDEVVKDVKKDAKTEGWGVPGGLPEWVAAIHPSFDSRVRYAENFYGNSNQSSLDSEGQVVDPTIGPFNWLQINKDGGLDNAINKNEAYLNNQKDRLRLSERFRLGFEAKIADGLKAGIRFATSNMYNPVSNNQTLGNTGQSYQVAIDRSYLQYDFIDAQGTDWFSLYGGRFANPFVSTDVVYDPDLSFEGVAGTFRLHFNQGSSKFSSFHIPAPGSRVGINQGQQSPDSVFMTLGAFPIQAINFAPTDKWLFGGQAGADWLVFNDARMQIATSYYSYKNINARKNVIGHEYDWTAPQFVQKGNSMVAITDSQTNDGQVCFDVYGCLFGLASEFKIFNATAIFDYAGFAPAHVMFTLDYAKNLGFNQQRIASEFSTDVLTNGGDIKPRTNAYQARIDIGHPKIRRFADWNLNLAYRYVQRDAVLDAFTDSVFHQGGTDAKGWVLGTQHGITRNAWLNLRWYSTDAIDGPKYSVDTLYVDVNARF